jgi:four helix bundle protein
MAQNPSGETAAVVVQKTYDLVLWLVPKLEKFPKQHRFTLGQRIFDNALDLLSSLVEAAYTTEKAPMLRTASRKTNVLRYLLRLSKDLRLLALNGYTHATERLDEVGRMIGGWQKTARA